MRQDDLMRALHVTLQAPASRRDNYADPNKAWDQHCTDVCRCLIGLEPIQRAQQK